MRYFRDRIINYLEQRYLPDLSKHIATELYIERFNSYLGSAFSGEPILIHSACFRPHNRSEDIPNLYFIRLRTHQGAGLPSVMSSGKIVAPMIG